MPKKIRLIASLLFSFLFAVSAHSESARGSIEMTLLSADTDAVPQQIPGFITRAIAQLKSINSADLRYVMSSRGLMESKPSYDTVTMRVFGLREPGSLCMIIKDPDNTIVYRDSTMIWVTKSAKTIYTQVVDQSKIKARLDYWFYQPMMNGGAGIEYWLKTSGSTKDLRYDGIGQSHAHSKLLKTE